LGYQEHKIALSVKEIAKEILYVRGTVIGESKVWSETNVSGTAGRNNTNVNISSTTTTWTSFMMALENGKEREVSFSANIGQDKLGRNRLAHILNISIYANRVYCFCRQNVIPISYHLGVSYWYFRLSQFLQICSPVSPESCFDYSRYGRLNTPLCMFLGEERPR